MTFIKYLVLLADAGILLGFIYFAIVDGLDGEVLLFFGLTSLVALNIYFIFSYPIGEDWLALKLKRKALEEKKKINELSKQE